MNKKLILIIFGLYIPFTTLAHKKPQHQITQKYSINKFDPTHDTQPIINIFNKNWDFLVGYHVDMNDFSPQHWLDYHHNNPHIYGINVLRINNEFVGFIAYHIKNLKNSPYGWIDAVAIENNFRNKGYGKILVKNVIEQLYTMGTRSIGLVTQINNIPAQHLYEAIGFKKTMCEDDQILFEYPEKTLEFPGFF